MDRLGFELPLRRFPRGRFLLPFCGAAKHSCMLYRHLFVCQECFDCIPCILCRDLLDAVAVVDPALVTKTAVLVEDENMWSRLGPIGSCHRLRVAIEQIGVAQMAVLDTDLHFIQCVAYIGGVQLIDCYGLRILAPDCHARNSPFSVVVIMLLSPEF